MKRSWTITNDKFLSKEQVARLLEYMEERRDLVIARGCRDKQPIRDFYLVRTMLETGVRVQECCDLLDDELAGLKLLVRRGKGNKTRTILLTRSTSHMLNEWISLKQKLRLAHGRGHPLFPSRYGTSYSTRGVQKRIKEVFSALSFPKHLSAHSLRHTNCSLLLESKVSLSTIRDNLGHHSIAVTNLYAHACGSIEHVDLLSSSDNYEKPEPRAPMNRTSMRNPVVELLRKANFK